MALHVRPATEADHDAIWAVLEPVFRRGDTYAIDPGVSREGALGYWLAPGTETFVAEGEDGTLVGTYILKPNQGGRGAHVANAAYVVAPQAQGRGIGRFMAEHSIETARARGYRAMQYNLVVSTNSGAIRLWERLGFEKAGRLPGAFDHPEAGEVDAFVMYRRLD